MVVRAYCLFDFGRLFYGPYIIISFYKYVYLSYGCNKRRIVKEAYV